MAHSIHDLLDLKALEVYGYASARAVALDSPKVKPIDVLYGFMAIGRSSRAHDMLAAFGVTTDQVSRSGVIETGLGPNHLPQPTTPVLDAALRAHAIADDRDMMRATDVMFLHGLLSQNDLEVFGVLLRANHSLYEQRIYAFYAQVMREIYKPAVRLARH